MHEALSDTRASQTQIRSTPHTTQQTRRSMMPPPRATAPAPYTKTWGNQPPPWLRLASPPPAADEQPTHLQVRQDAAPQETRPSRPRANTTGLPDALKTGAEQLSGLSLDDVHVHYNSPKPAQVQALAHTQGTEIHVGPGQERHLPHETWHVVQQMQGRVRPTSQHAGLAINDDHSLEREADTMGRVAFQTRVGNDGEPAPTRQDVPSAYQPVVQLMKISELQLNGFVYKFHRSNVAYKYLKVDDQYHITIFPNDATWTAFKDLRKSPPKSGTVDIRILPSDGQFEFDELHVTDEKERGHFFYKANGEPLAAPQSPYAGNGSSVEWEDVRWFATNRIIANLLGRTEEEINDLWVQIVYPANQQNPTSPPVATKPATGSKTPSSLKLSVDDERQLQRAFQAQKNQPSLPPGNISTFVPGSGITGTSFAPIKFSLPSPNKRTIGSKSPMVINIPLTPRNQPVVTTTPSSGEQPLVITTQPSGEQPVVTTTQASSEQPLVITTQSSDEQSSAEKRKKPEEEENESKRRKGEDS